MVRSQYVALAIVAVLAVGFGATVSGDIGVAGVSTQDTVTDDPTVRSSSTAAPSTSFASSAVSADLDCPSEHRVESRPASNSTTDGTTTTDHQSAEPRIVELYPNPTTHGNVGEYLVLDVPAETTLRNWTITDGHTTANLPSETVSGRIALSTDPDATDPLTEDVVHEVDGTLRLAVDGDVLELRNGTETVDQVAYERAPVAERWYRTDRGDVSKSTADPGDGQWWPRDATCRPVSTADVDEATAFVLPDAPAVPKETIREADDRLLLAGYTITSAEIAAELVAAADRGVDIEVLIESGPVGGTPAATEPVLETLASSGVEVRAIGGEGARYRYHHPKYAVADDRVLVTTENWKPSGVGGQSSRGWGVELEDDVLASELAAVFDTDFAGWDTVSSAAFRENATFVEDDGIDAPREFPTEHDPTTVSADTAELLLAPDNAEGRLSELLATADDEILIKQASLDSDLSLVDDVLAAAERGVDVQVLLDSTWYHEDANAAVAADLERAAAQAEGSLAVRLVEDTDRFEKIHAKGVVIDREIAVVGSANWNENAFENNREVLVALHGEDAANYYAAVFEDDWDGDSWSLPVGLSAGVLVALVAAALLGHRYIRFGDE